MKIDKTQCSTVPNQRKSFKNPSFLNSFDKKHFKLRKSLLSLHF